MKVKTNTGEVELTPDMVRKGMVFTADDGANQMTIGDGYGTEEEQRRAVPACDAMTGCDPTIADRADVERYGIAPGFDAAKHGFARVRGGGALDLRRECPAGAVYEGAAFRCTLHEGRWPLSSVDVLVGLDSRHASHDDMDRLCCGEWIGPRDGESPPSRRCTLAIGDHDVHEDLATGTKWSDAPSIETATGKALDDLARQFDVCRTFGETDDTLRQRATRVAKVRQERAPLIVHQCCDCGARHGEKHKDDCAKVVAYLASRCNAQPVRGQVLKSRHDDSIRIATGEERCDNTDCEGRHTMAYDYRHFDWEQSPTFQLCAVCLERVMPYGEWSLMWFSVYDYEAERTRGGPVCETCFERHKGHAAELRWDGERLVPKNQGFQLSGVSGENTPPILRDVLMRLGYGGCTTCGASPAQHHQPGCEQGKADEKTLRQYREAPLVALVNDVPEGLNADGWRAAVLAATEGSDDPVEEWRDAACTYVLCARFKYGTLIDKDIEWSNDTAQRAVAAYQRAIAPRSPSPPVKTRQGGGAAFKSKGLPLDMGDG